MNELYLPSARHVASAVVVEAAPSGVDKILEQAAKIDPKLLTVTGGFHLVRTPEAEVQRIAGVLQNVALKVERAGASTLHERARILGASQALRIRVR